MVLADTTDILSAIDREIEAHEQELKAMMGSQRLSRFNWFKCTITLNTSDDTEFKITIGKDSICIQKNGNEIALNITTAIYARFDLRISPFPPQKRELILNTETVIKYLCEARHKIKRIMEWNADDSNLGLVLVGKVRQDAASTYFYERFTLHFEI